MKLVFDEQYGELSPNQRLLYKAYNVSPADHSLLVMEFGEHRRGAIVKAVLDRSPSGQFNFFHDRVW